MEQQIISTIDVVLLTIEQNELAVALLKRPNAPYQGVYALPGGYVHQQEDNGCFDAAMRILREKVGIEPPYLEQLKTFSGPARDPRGWSISVAYFAIVPCEIFAKAKSETVILCQVDKIKSLAFDHNQIVETAVQRIRNKSQYSSLPCHLAGKTFTLPELQSIYEICMGVTLNKVTFRKKIEEMNILEAVKGAQQTGPHRPAQIYQLKPEFEATLKIVDRGL